MRLVYAVFPAGSVERNARVILFGKPLDGGLPDAQQAASANAAGLVYSGYVQAGKEALAIIGGLEYGVGDTLPNTGDVIRFIGSDGVRLYSPSRNAEWTLPYSGDDI